MSIGDKQNLSCIWYNILLMISYGDCDSWYHNHRSGVNLCMRPANERHHRFSVTLSLIGWEYTKNNPSRSVFYRAINCHNVHMSSIFITDTITGNDRIKHFLIEDIGTNHEQGCFNTLRLRQNGCHFAGKISELISVSENSCIWIQIPLRFVPEGAINV